MTLSNPPLPQNTCRHTLTQIDAHIHTHTRIDTHAHTHIHTHTHSHTHTLSLSHTLIPCSRTITLQSFGYSNTGLFVKPGPLLKAKCLQFKSIEGTSRYYYLLALC